MSLEDLFDAGAGLDSEPWLWSNVYSAAGGTALKISTSYSANPKSRLMVQNTAHGCSLLGD